MKKLSLADLSVESFATSAHPAARGTVAAHSDTEWSVALECATEAGMASCSPATCQPTYHDAECGTTTNPPPTHEFYATCAAETCVMGDHGCGTVDQPSCVHYGGDGCGGATGGVWHC